MRKLIKILVILDLLIFVLALIFWFFTKDDNLWAGMAFVYPAIGLGITILIALLFSFTSALKSSISNNITIPKLFVNLVALIGVPLLGLLYSVSGENRESLKVVSIGALVLATLLTIYMISRNLRLK